MKRWSLLVLLVAILPASVAAGAARVAAAPPADVATAAVAPTDGIEYLIGLPLPREWPVATPSAAGAPSLTWHATAERAAPDGVYAAAHCDAVYDLQVDWAQVGLPLLMGR